MYARNLSALDFTADFPPIAPEFQQRMHRVRLRNLGTTDKKIISQNQAQKDSGSTGRSFFPFWSMAKERRFRNMIIVCCGGIFAALFFLAWSLCRAAGWEKEREDLEQEKYLKEWQEKKLKKSKKIEN